MFVQPINVYIPHPCHWSSLYKIRNLSSQPPISGTPKAYPFLCNLLVGPARRDTSNGVDSGLRGFNSNRGVGGGNRGSNGGGSISTYGGPQQPTVTRNFVPKQQPRTQKPRTQQRPKTKKPKRKKPKTQKPRKQKPRTQKPRTQEVFSGLLPSYGRSPTSRQRIYSAG